MKYVFGVHAFFLYTLVLLPTALLFSQEQSLGMFEANSDIGDVLKKGWVTFDSVKYIKLSSYSGRKRLKGVKIVWGVKS